MQEEEIYNKLEHAYFSDSPDEAAVLEKLPLILGNCRHFVDIGASIGQYTYNANLIMRNGRIDSYEAEPVRFKKLRENCGKWQSSRSNILLAHHAAVAKSSGAIIFHTTQSSISGGIFPNRLDHLDESARASVNWTTIEVPAVSLDDLYGNAPPDFIKMDIEGAEGEALQGAIRLLRKRRTTWLIELHGFEGGWKPGEVIFFMREHGYRAEEVAEGRFLFTPMTGCKYLFNKIRRQK